MLYIIRDVIFIFFAIVGVLDIVRNIALFLMRTENDKDVFIVVPIFDNFESVEMLLRSVASRVKWIGGGRFNKVLCINCNADDETKLICEKVCDEFPFMEFVEKIDLEQNYDD